MDLASLVAARHSAAPEDAGARRFMSPQSKVSPTRAQERPAESTAPASPANAEASVVLSPQSAAMPPALLGGHLARRVVGLEAKLAAVRAAAGSSCGCVCAHKYCIDHSLIFRGRGGSGSSGVCLHDSTRPGQ